MSDDMREQYKTPANLNARANLHARYSTNSVDWLPWVFGHLRERLPETARILEAGCGPGALWAVNRDDMPAGWRLTLTDFSEGMIARARDAMEDAGLVAECVQADIQELPFDDGAFDGVIANHMLYHVLDIDRGLSEIKRVLAPEGIVFAATNGTGHMQELYDLGRAYDPRIEVTQDPFPLRFGLENGREILRRHFSDVELIEYDCDLRVDEAGPLAEYVFSLAGMGTGFEPVIRERERFSAFLEQRVRDEGIIHISKNVGIFIAHNQKKR